MAVPSLMVSVHTGASEFELGECAEKSLSDIGMALNQSELRHSQPRGLAQDLVRDSDLSEVVNLGGGANGLDLARLESNRHRQLCRERCNSGAMPCGIRFFRLDESRQEHDWRRIFHFATHVDAPTPPLQAI